MLGIQGLHGTVHSAHSPADTASISRAGRPDTQKRLQILRERDMADCSHSTADVGRTDTAHPQICMRPFKEEDMAQCAHSTADV